MSNEGLRLLNRLKEGTLKKIDTLKKLSRNLGIEMGGPDGSMVKTAD